MTKQLGDLRLVGQIPIRQMLHSFERVINISRPQHLNVHNNHYFAGERQLDLLVQFPLYFDAGDKIEIKCECVGCVCSDKSMNL